MADVLFGRPPLMVDTVAAVTLFKKMDWSGLEPGPRPFRAGGVVSSSSSILVVFRFFCLLVCFCFFNHSSRKKPIEGRSVRISFPSIFLRSTHRTIQTKLDGLVRGGAWSISRSQSGGRKNELVSAVHPAASFAAPLSVKKKTSSFAKLSSPSSSSSSIVFVESNRRISTIEFECIFDEKAGGNGKEILEVVHFSLFFLS